MRVLVACEFSGVVAEAFHRKGHEVHSCDLLDCSHPNREWWHYKGPVEDIIWNLYWDLIIAHPPCTYLAVSGNGSYANRPDLYEPAVEFAKMFFEYAPKVCVENPVGRLSSKWRKPDQYVQPWMFGHKETKKTGLWLKNLPKLEPTNIVEGPYEQRIWRMAPSEQRSYLRSITYQGIADAMAEQWG